MIECLSSPEWINPQLNFLEMLQNVRNAHFLNFNGFFLSVTILGETWLPTLICAVIYWCICPKSGMYLFSLYGVELYLTQLFKMLACVYRPWVLSDKIKPVEKAIAMARGYSFPSGHSATSSSILGGIAFLNRKNKLVLISLVFLFLLVGFSRMWLGVHTPQDVVVGLSIGICCVFAMNYLIEFFEKNKKRYLYAIFVFDVLVVLALIYVCFFNQFPMDYIGGQLLVDPKHSIQSFLYCQGYALGLVNGAFLCRYFKPFDLTSITLKQKIFRAVIGIICLIILLKYVASIMFACFANFGILFCYSRFVGLFVTLFYPLMFQKFQKQ
ncbi:phosphatase PAP2 family protein [bacterium]|nr:phosphatase PAP2 family protein [bacterium]